jgi:manganese efflux pump family protein
VAAPDRRSASWISEQGERMSFFEVLLMAVGLAMDCFAVSLGIGTTGYANSPRSLFRLSYHFGLFQALMPVLGWVIGTQISSLVSSFDHWIAFALLAFVGVRMIRSGLDAEGESHTKDPSRGGTLVMLSVATSIDAFAIGLTLAMLQVNIFYPSLVIGVVTGILSLIGLLVGNRLGLAFGKRMEVIGGVLLILIGLRVLLSHMLV